MLPGSTEHKHRRELSVLCDDDELAQLHTKDAANFEGDDQHQGFETYVELPENERKIGRSGKSPCGVGGELSHNTTTPQHHSPRRPGKDRSESDESFNRITKLQNYTANKIVKRIKGNSRGLSFLGVWVMDG